MYWEEKTVLFHYNSFQIFMNVLFMFWRGAIGNEYFSALVKVEERLVQEASQLLLEYFLAPVKV